jgi:hypothetical protein
MGKNTRLCVVMLLDTNIEIKKQLFKGTRGYQAIPSPSYRDFTIVNAD